MNRSSPKASSASAWYRGRKGGRVFAALLVLALALFILDRIQHPTVDSARSAVGDFFRPVVSVLVAPINWGKDGLDWVRGVSQLYDENRALTEEAERLRQWREVALRLDAENSRLKALLNAPDVKAEPVAAPQVIGISGGSFVRSVVVNAGTEAGVRVSQPVLDEVGVVGRVIAAGANTARVLLITDLNSRVPVRIERTGVNAIAQGRNRQTIDLAFLPLDSDVQVGDRVMTSGQGGVFPPGLIVGDVVDVDGATPTIIPAAFLDRLDFVRVLDYRLPAPEDLSLQPSPSAPETEAEEGASLPDESSAGAQAGVGTAAEEG